LNVYTSAFQKNAKSWTEQVKFSSWQRYSPHTSGGTICQPLFYASPLQSTKEATKSNVSAVKLKGLSQTLGRNRQVQTGNYDACKHF
jgi:hypothetical protein